MPDARRGGTTFSNISPPVGISPMMVVSVAMVGVVTVTMPVAMVSANPAMLVVVAMMVGSLATAAPSI